MLPFAPRTMAWNTALSIFVMLEIYVIGVNSLDEDGFRCDTNSVFGTCQRTFFIYGWESYALDDAFAEQHPEVRMDSLSGLLTFPYNRLCYISASYVRASLSVATSVDSFSLILPFNLTYTQHLHCLDDRSPSPARQLDKKPSPSAVSVLEQSLWKLCPSPSPCAFLVVSQTALLSEWSDWYLNLTELWTFLVPNSVVLVWNNEIVSNQRSVLFQAETLRWKTLQLHVSYLINDTIVVQAKPAAIDMGSSSLSPALMVIVRRCGSSRKSRSTRGLNLPPTITPSTITVTLSEDVPIGHAVAVVTAKDPENGRVTFSLSSVERKDADLLFKIDPFTGEVRVAAKLDHDAGVSTLLFTITASDDGVPPMSSHATLLIQLDDVNDNSPIFEQSMYNVSVSEADSIGKRILEVRATDRDSGANAEILYSIVPHRDPIPFDIERQLGSLSIASTLDRETVALYHFKIRANDRGQPSLFGLADVFVIVEDVNDNAPVFAEKVHNVSVPENTEVNTVVAKLVAYDADVGINSKITYTMPTGKYMLFLMDPGGEIRLVAPLDFENPNMRQFVYEVRATDGGVPPLSGFAKLVITVTDVNDNTPEFTQKSWSVRVSEDVPVGHVVLKVTAIDRDAESNGLVMYKLSSPSPLPFDINSEGVIRTSDPLDHELVALYQFVVIAFDGGSVSRSSSVPVAIEVENVNDNIPVFNATSYIVSVPETLTYSSVIVRVFATDADDTETTFSNIQYSIVGGNERDCFKVDGLGRVILQCMLRHDVEPFFNMTVVANDGKWQAETNVLVMVLDANTHAPRFETHTYQSSVYENCTIGTRLIQILATDADVGENARLSYSFSPPQGDITIDDISGVVYTLRALDRELTPQYVVQVVAADHGDPVMTGTALFILTVLDVNDNTPQFSQLRYDVSILENVPVNFRVVQVKAVDRDQGKNGEVYYRILEEDTGQVFYVDSQTGWIRTSITLDRETTPSYTFHVIAMDRGNPPLNSTAVVRISLVDVKDSPPVFAKKYYNITLSENVRPGTLTVKLTATCADLGENSRIFYSISSGNIPPHFIINSQDGTLETVTSLDYETKPEYRIIVRAMSGPFFDSAEVRIYLIDENDNIPTLSNFLIMLNTIGQTGLSNIAFTIPAEDRDKRDRLTYSIVSGNAHGLLSLDENKGLLTVSPNILNTGKAIQIDVKVNDGLHEVTARGSISAFSLTRDLLANTISIKITNTTVLDYLNDHTLRCFIDVVSEVLRTEPSCIHVLSVSLDKEVGPIRVVFVARTMDRSRAVTPAEAYHRLFLDHVSVSKRIVGQLVQEESDVCVEEPCPDYFACTSHYLVGAPITVTSRSVILYSPSLSPLVNCSLCPQGYQSAVRGTRRVDCSVPFNLCHSSPCLNHGQCFSVDGGYACVCQQGYTGKNCAVRLLDTSCDKDEYQLCRNGGICKGNSSSELCSCSSVPGPTNSLCELLVRSFSREGYAAYPGVSSRWKLHISFDFATRADGLLLYNGRHSLQNDFLALEVVDGQVVAHVSLHSETTTLITFIPGGVIDGTWHNVALLFENQVFSVAVDNCDIHIASYINSTFEPSCLASARMTGKYRSLDLQGPLHVGGLSQLVPYGAMINRDYAGCIRNLNVNHETLDLAVPISVRNSRPGCGAMPEPSICTPTSCTHGQCRMTADGPVCVCDSSRSGKYCEKDLTHLPAWGSYSFSGAALYNKLVSGPGPFQLSMMVLTVQRSAALAHILVGTQHLVLQVSEGHVEVLINATFLDIRNITVSTNRRHHVQLRLVDDLLELVIDYDNLAAVKLPPSVFAAVAGSVRLVSLGGVVRSPSLITDSYQGCIQDITINGKSFDPLLDNYQPNLRQGCESKSCSRKTTCQGNGECVSKGGITEFCACKPGYIGRSCTSLCTFKPCQNGGTCEITSQGYQCVCPRNTSGLHCERITQDKCHPGFYGDPTQGLCGPCNCDTTKGFNPICDPITGQCFCKEDHYQTEGWCVRCDCFPDGSRGTDCNPSTGKCFCLPEVVGRQCDRCISTWEEIQPTKGCVEINTSCPKSYADDILWNRISFSETRYEKCPSGSSGNASRFCHPKTSWKEPVLVNCANNDFLEMQDQLVQLRSGQLASTQLLMSQLASRMEFATTTGRRIYTRDIQVAYNVLDLLIETESSNDADKMTAAIDDHFVLNILKVLNRLLERDMLKQWENLKHFDGVAQLMAKVERFLKLLVQNLVYVKLGDRAMFQTSTLLPPLREAVENILLVIQPTTADSDRMHTYPVPHAAHHRSGPKWRDAQVNITIPDILFRMPGVVVQEGEVNVGMVVYRTLGGLLPANFFPESLELDPMALYSMRVASTVVSLVVPGLEDKTLSQPILFSFQVNQVSPDEDVRCAHWNYSSSESSPGGWTTKECRMVQVNPPNSSHQVSCECFHLSTYAAIAISKSSALYRLYSPAIPTYACAGASLLILMASMTVLILLRQLRSNYCSIHRNLGMSVFLAQLLYITSVNRTENERVCKVISVLLHYLFSTTLSWLFVEALHIYRMLTERRNINYGQMMFYYFLGWGGPLILVSVTAGLSPEGYRTNRFCWISLERNVLWIFLAPIIAVTLGIISLLGLSFYQCWFFLSPKLVSESALVRARYALVSSSVLLPILLCTFMSALVAVHRDTQVFQYVFSVSCLLQGFYLLLRHVVLDKEVRTEFVNAYMRKKTGDRSYGRTPRRDVLMRSPHPPPGESSVPLLNFTTSSESTPGLPRRNLFGPTQTAAGKYSKSNGKRAGPSPPFLNNPQLERVAKLWHMDCDTTTDVTTTAPNSSEESSDDDDDSNPESAVSIHSTSTSSSEDNDNDNSVLVNRNSRKPMNKATKKLPKPKLRLLGDPAESWPAQSTPLDSYPPAASASISVGELPGLMVREITQKDNLDSVTIPRVVRTSAESDSNSSQSQKGELRAKPPSILKKHSRYGESSDSETERKVRSRVVVRDPLEVKMIGQSPLVQPGEHNTVV